MVLTVACASLSEMAIHIERAGERFGPYTSAEIRKHLAKGELVPTDLAWHKGMNEWQRLASLFPEVSGPGIETGTDSLEKRPPRPARRYSGVVIAAVVILTLSFLLSPYFAIWRLSEAVESGDRKSLEQRIDFPAVRTGLKADLSAYFKRAAADRAKGNDDPFGDLVGSIAQPLVDGMIDSMVTPDGVAALIAESKVPQTEGKSVSPPTESSNSGIEWSEIRYAFFTSPTQFLVDTKEVKVRMSLTRSGWKVTRVEASPETFESALKQG